MTSFDLHRGRRRSDVCRAASCALVVWATFAVGATAAAQTPPACEIDVSVDLDAGTFRGHEVVRTTNVSKGAVDVVFFNIWPNLGAKTTAERAVTVSAVTVDGAPVAFSQQGAGVLVRLAARLAPGGRIEIGLDFEGAATRVSMEQIGLGAHVTDQVTVVLTPAERRPREGSDQLVVSGDSMYLGNPFPLLSAARDDAWHREVSAGNFAFAEARSVRISVTAPDGVAVVASGAGLERADGGAHVFEGDALRNLAVFASRGFARIEAQREGVRLAVVARPAHAEAAKDALATLGRAVELYDDRFGPPPFPSLTVVEAPYAPGMPSSSASGVIGVASAYWIDMRGPEAKDLPGFIKDSTDLTREEREFAVLRETARQWWGEAVGIDPQRSAFLDEGLTTFSALLAVETGRGAEGLTAAVEQRLRAPYRVFRMFGGLDTTVGRRAGEFPNYFAFGAIVGSKSAMFLIALRDRLGDERFFDGLTRFYRDGKGDIVRPEDFAAAMAPPDARGNRAVYDRLFDRWIKERHGDEDIGAPEYAVAVDPKVVESTRAPDASSQGSVERFGRFIGRKFAWFGKTAAKPF